MEKLNQIDEENIMEKVRAWGEKDEISYGRKIYIDHIFYK